MGARLTMQLQLCLRATGPAPVGQRPPRGFVGHRLFSAETGTVLHMCAVRSQARWLLFMVPASGLLLYIIEFQPKSMLYFTEKCITLQ